MRRATLLLVPPVVLAVAACSLASSPSPGAVSTSPVADADADAELVAHGEYLTRIAGCNDCHTPGFGETGGDVPKAQWLMGSPVGWHGPWGTTYATNLRLKLQDMDEAAWMDYSASLHARPPMPYYTLRAMNERDRRAIYRFIKSLGPGGVPAPVYLAPGQPPSPPYIDWVMPPVPTHTPTPG